MTIVSAFIANINDRQDMNLEKYINNGKKLIELPVPKIIFLDEMLIDRFSDVDQRYTRIVPTKKSDLYLFDRLGEMTEFALSTDKPDKDTLKYICVQCHKTEWVRQAIELNCFSTQQFIWVDFGIFYIFREDLETFQRSILSLWTKTYDRVRIASNWDLQIRYQVDVYKQIAWYFLGGVFGGDRESLLEFSDLVKSRCLQIIRERHSLMWENNVWYLVYQSYPELFEPYKADHNASITLNY